MTAINLDDMSIEELQALQGGIDAAVERKKVSELLAVREQLDALINDSPYTLEEVLEAKAMRKPVAPKYANPADNSQTWTGRGRKPVWVVAHLEQGGTLEEIMI